MIDPAIWSDSKVIQLTSKEFVVWLGCISNADDEGIFEADPASFYFKLARQDISISEISSAFAHLSILSMIRCYSRFAFIPTWFKHQVLNRPNETKNQRPTEKLLAEHPEYVSAWENTFSTQSKQKKYPYESCSEDSVSNHGVHTEYSVPMEWNGMEEKGKEINTSREQTKKEIVPVSVFSDSGIPEPAVLEKSVSKSQQKRITSQKELDPLYHPILESFKSRNSDITDWDREGTAIKQIIGRVRALSPPNPEEFACGILEAFYKLRQGRENFWRGQPFTPMTLNTKGIWDRVLVEYRRRTEKKDVDKLFSEANHDGERVF